MIIVVAANGPATVRFSRLLTAFVALCTVYVPDIHAQSTEESVAQALLRLGDYKAASGAYAKLLRNPKYEENDPARMRQLQSYSNALYLAKDIAGARAALTAALSIQSALGAREHRSSVAILGPLAVMERDLGHSALANQYCAELKALEPNSPPVPPAFSQAVQATCSEVALPLQRNVGGAKGDWGRAATIGTKLGIESSAQHRELVSRASMWVNLLLGDKAPVKVSPSWEVPLERPEAETAAIFVAKAHKSAGSGAFVPAGAQRAIVLEEALLNQPQPTPPNPIKGTELRLEKVHLVVAILLHELGHALDGHQATYATATCSQRKAMESKADQFAAETLRAALVGDRGLVALAAAEKTLRNLIGLGWTFTSTRSLRELAPESLRGDPAALSRAYCEEGASYPAMELRLLRMYRTMLGPEYRSIIGNDDLSEVVVLFEGSAKELPDCNCLK